MPRQHYFYKRLCVHPIRVPLAFMEDPDHTTNNAQSAHQRALEIGEIRNEWQFPGTIQPQTLQHHPLTESYNIAISP